MSSELDPERSMEHRCGYRRAVNVPVILRTRVGLVGRAIVSDVSASGAFVSTSLPIAVHAVVVVQFDVPEVDGRTRRVNLEAEIVRHTPTGFGLEWTEFAPAAVRELYAAHSEHGLEMPRVRKYEKAGSRK
jgi:hypothetical protein